MTEVYTAPTNGHKITKTGTRDTTIEENTWGGLHVSHWRAGGAVLGIEIADDLREYFRDERDEELGRWRWPENPGYVVYELTRDRVRVVDEVTGLVNDINRDTSPTRSDHSPEVAKAYFDAHPVKKPWHDAKPGDTWVITTTFHPGEFAVIATTEGKLQSANGFCYDPTDKSIISGERIWERK